MRKFEVVSGFEKLKLPVRKKIRIGKAMNLIMDVPVMRVL